ncbi:hypothetical protein H7097_04360 [Aeromicrobium sp.]|nr:hypothetical protein [Candidatus Saccharibacteria bacterium]
MAEAAVQPIQLEHYGASVVDSFQLIQGEFQSGQPVEYQPPHVRVVDQTLADAIELAMRATVDSRTLRPWLSVDELPSIKAKRDIWDTDSHALVAERKELLNAGEFSAVPYAFNVLSTAKKVLDSTPVPGKESTKYDRLKQGFYLDCHRHRDEARRRLTWEYFAEVEQPFDEQHDSFMYGDYVLKDVVDNGLSPVGSEEVGLDVLIANRREEYTSAEIAKLGRLMLDHAGVEFTSKQLTMVTISQVKNSPQTMIWAHRFDPQQNRRFHEQVGFTKEYITHDVITEFIKQKGVISPSDSPSEVDVLDIQSLSLDGDGVLDVVQSLDTIASATSGKNIFMGEEVAADFAKDYSAVPAESAKRQLGNEEQVDELMTEILRLAEARTDDWLANSLIDTFVTNMLLDGVKNDPAAARNIFGPDTAFTIQRSINERQRGNYELADQLIVQARSEAPVATVCTGGSCGLVEVNLLSTDASKARELGLGSGLLKDTVRKCKNPGCGAKNILYDDKGNKACTTCGSKQIKGKVTITTKQQSA